MAACVAANGTAFLEFEWWDASELAGRQMENDLKHTAKEANKSNSMQWPSQSAHLTLIVFKCPKDKQEVMTVAVETQQAAHHQGWKPASGHVCAFQTSAVIDCSGFATKD